MIASPAHSGGVLLARHLGAQEKAIPHCSQASLAFVAALNSNPAVVCGGRGRQAGQTRRDEDGRDEEDGRPSPGLTDQVVCSCLMPHASCSGASASGPSSWHIKLRLF